MRRGVLRSHVYSHVQFAASDLGVKGKIDFIGFSCLLSLSLSLTNAEEASETGNKSPEALRGGITLILLLIIIIIENAN